MDTSSCSFVITNEITMKRKILLLALICLYIAVQANHFTKQITVDGSGGGDYTSLQMAVNAIRAFDPDGGTVILLKNGVYHEKIVIPDYVCNVKIVGENKEHTVISFNDHAKINNMGTFNTYTMQIRGNDIILENLTVENIAEPLGQAVALHTEGSRLIFKNCNFRGNQDTVYVGGEDNKLFFLNCYVEGTTDYIFGGATAWFEKCELHCKSDSYITAASTPQQVEFGFIFNNCTITVAPEVKSVYLGRPWRKHAMTVFMNCYLPPEINPVGWDNWSNPENEKAVRYAEYGNAGDGFRIDERKKCTKILSKNEAKKITMKTVLGEFIKN